MYFESHAHYDDEAFNEDRKELIENLLSTDIRYIINSASNMSSSRSGIELAGKYPNFYAAVGVHPHEVQELTEEKFGELEELCSASKVVAVGEIGLDYYYDKEWSELQKYWLKRQLELAKKVKLPVIIHSREAAQDCFDIIKESNLPKERAGVIHCFSGSVEMAKQYIEMGFYIGVGGVVTFKNAKKTVDVVEAIPLNKILIETDSPYLAPVPNRGQRNNSQNLKFIAEKIASIKQIEPLKVAKVTMENGKNLFRV